MQKLLFILILFANNSFAQHILQGIKVVTVDSFLGDSVNTSPNRKFNEKIKLVQIDNSTAKIDIRLYRHHSLSNTINLRRIFILDSSWDANEYQEYNNPKKIKKSKLKSKLDFDSLFSQFLSYDILNLPNQVDLKSKMRKVVGVDEQGYEMVSKILVTDGESYTIELKVGNKFRIYQFDNPDSYIKIYENVTELKDYLSIVQTFNNVLAKK